MWQKGLKLKVGKFWGLILTFDEVKRKNLAGRLFTRIGLKVFMITVNHISLLLQINSVSMHQRHLGFLMTEIYKSISEKILNKRIRS